MVATESRIYQPLVRSRWDSPLPDEDARIALDGKCRGCRKYSSLGFHNSGIRYVAISFDLSETCCVLPSPELLNEFSDRQTVFVKEALYLGDTDSSLPKQLNCFTEGQALVSKQFHEQLYDVIFDHTNQYSITYYINITTRISIVGLIFRVRRDYCGERVR